jgi:hypothetical protein
MSCPALTTDQIIRLGALFLLLVPGFGAVGHFLGGLVAMALGKNEELWMRRGEIMSGCIGLGGWVSVALVTVST